MEAPLAVADVHEQGGVPEAGAGESQPPVADIAIESSGKRKREEEGEETPAIEPVRHPMWKTSLCSFYRRLPRSGSCSHGDNCRYAHGEAELRPRPDNTWDPTSDRAKMLLKTDTDAAAAADDPPVTLDETALDKHITGLPKKWVFDNLKNFLDGKGISFKTAKKKKGMSIAFVAFENIEQVKNSVAVLNENATGGNQIKVADAIGASHDKKSINRTSPHSENQTGIADPIISSSLNESDDAVGNDTSVVEGLASKARSARDVVTPLADMPYSDQLKHKKRSLSQILKRLTKNAHKACPDAVPPPDWITKSRGIGGLPCKFEGILESPLVNGYRNKCEFSVGYSLQGTCTVGFTLGNFREGVTAVEEPFDCPNVSRIACNFASIFQKFLHSSSLPVWNKMDNTGFWRQFTVREGRNSSQVAAIETQVAEVMIIVQVCSSNVDEDEMKNEFQRMVQALAQGAAECSPPLPLTTVVVQDHKGISNAAPADCPLIVLPVPKIEGYSCSHDTEARIHDYISNLRFSISPTAFFQVNTLAAERLYSLAGDWANLSPDSLLFDICCGTGTIGLTLAHRVGMVVGIEMNNSAVSDAQRNAEINGINNCRFVCSKAEDVMGSLLKEYLDAPQQCAHDSNLSGIESIENSTCLEERASKKRKVIGDREEKSGEYTKHGESVTDCSAENGADDSIADHDPDHESVDSLKFLKGCTSECTKSSQGNDSSENRKPTNAASTRQFKDVVAIVDPPRVGLHPVVIKALRTHPRIRRLVYISCNPESLVANAIELCTPTTDKPERGNGNRVWRNTSIAGLARNRAKSMPNSEPFIPVKAMAVDLFPHTPHCEMVMLLER